MTHNLNDREIDILIDNVSDKVINNKNTQTQIFAKKLNKHVKKMKNFSEKHRLLFMILAFNGLICEKNNNYSYYSYLTGGNGDKCIIKDGVMVCRDKGVFPSWFGGYGRRGYGYGYGYPYYGGYGYPYYTGYYPYHYGYRRYGGRRYGGRRYGGRRRWGPVKK